MKPSSIIKRHCERGTSAAIFLMIVITLLVLSLTKASAQYSANEGTYSVSPVQNDTLLKFPHTKYESLATAKGYFYIDYTALTAVDGTMQVGVMVKENNTEKFVPGCDLITLSNSTAQTTINGTSIYLFHDVDGVRTWQILVTFDLLPGSYPAIHYKKNSADTGSFNYKLEVLK